jgi:hypothetical protein
MSTNVRSDLIAWCVFGGAVFGIILLGLNYTYLLWKECKIRRGGCCTHKFAAQATYDENLKQNIVGTSLKLAKMIECGVSYI